MPRGKVVLVVTLVSILLTVLVAEAGVRLFGPEWVNAPREPAFIPDRHTGWRNAPYRSATFQRSEFSVHIAHNSLGMHDHELQPDPANRILFLGDSFVWGGYGAEVDGTFVNRLEHSLSRSMESAIEVVNAGVGGYSLGNDWEYYLRYGRDLHPDVVLVAVYLGNDLHQTRIPRFMASPTGFLMDRGFISPWNVRLSTWLWDHLHFTRIIPPPTLIIESWLRKGASSEEWNEQVFEHSLFVVPPPETAILDVQSGVSALEGLHSDVLDDGSLFGIVLIPSKYQLSLFPNATLDPTQPNVLLTDWAVYEGVPVLDLYPLLLESGWEGLYWLEDAHFNPSGQAQVAFWLEDWLLTENLLLVSSSR